MIGSFLTRGLVMVFGYAYPAYECYKTVERNKPDIEQLRFWCQYWILVAFLTVFERVCDTFVFWVPMYSEAKLAFYIYLWYPKTKGTSYVYDSFFKPYVAKHETDIDRNLLELRTRAGDYAVLYWQRAFTFAQTRIFDILQYIAAQSTSRPRPPQPQQKATRARQATAPPNKKPSAKVPPPSEEPPSPTSSASFSEEEEEEEAKEAEEIPESIASQALKVVSSISNSSLLRSTSVPSEKSNHTNSNEVETKSDEEASTSTSSVDKPENVTAEETVMEEAVRVTRARLRKNRSIPNDK